MIYFKEIFCHKHRLKYRIVSSYFEHSFVDLRNKPLPKNLLNHVMVFIRKQTQNPDSQLHRLVKKKWLWGWGFKKARGPTLNQCADITQVHRYNIG